MCFVDLQFEELGYEWGVKLFKYLEPQVVLGVHGSFVLEDEHMGQIDRIMT